MHQSYGILHQRQLPVFGSTSPSFTLPPPPKMRSSTGSVSNTEYSVITYINNDWKIAKDYEVPV